VDDDEAVEVRPGDDGDDAPSEQDVAHGAVEGEVAAELDDEDVDDDELDEDLVRDVDAHAVEAGAGSVVAAASARPLEPEAKRAVEAIVMVADSPVEVGVLAQLVEVAPVDVERALRELAEEYRSAGRGFELVAVAGGWRYQSHPDQAPYVERFVLEGQTAKLSAAALETLAIVAYKQPISRAQVATIRGVSVDGVVRTLEQRGYITEVARDPGPGQAILFGTTPLFLDKLGLGSLSDLPAIADFVPGADVVEALEHGLRVEEPAEATGSARPAVDPLDAELADDLGREPFVGAPVGSGVESDAVHASAEVVDIDLRDDGVATGTVDTGTGPTSGTSVDLDDEDTDPDPDTDDAVVDEDEDDDDEDGRLEDLDLAGGEPEDGGVVLGGLGGAARDGLGGPDGSSAGPDAPSWG
jgi:segregation and condensation protein B